MRGEFMKKRIGNKIKTLRTTNNLNQSELSELLNVTQASLSTYENGNKLPSLDVLIRIADYFKVSLDWLCDRKTSSQLYTGADLITFFLELKKYKYFNYTIDFVEIDIDTPTGTDTCPLLQLTLDESKYIYEFGVFSNYDFSQFMLEYKELEGKLENLNDSQLSENYMKMWLEQQLQHYSTLKIKKQEDFEE